MFFCKKKQQNIAGMVALTIKKGFNVQTKKTKFSLFCEADLYHQKKRRLIFMFTKRFFNMPRSITFNC